VEIGRRGEQFASRVQILDERGMARGARELTSDASSCSEIFDATALAISIALEVSNKEDAQPAADAPAAAGAPAPAEPESPRASPPPSVPEPLTPAPEEPRPSRAPVANPVSWLAGLDVLGSEGTAPAVSAGMAAFGELRVRHLSAALEVRFDAPAGTTTTDGTRATSWLYAAQIVPCVRFFPVSACALGSVGQFVVSGSGVSSPTSGTSLFAAAGARIGAEWPLSQTFLVRAHADGLLDLDPPTYRLDGVDRWGPAPRVAVTLGLGVAVRIP
jgi:hypothetical protein